MTNSIGSLGSPAQALGADTSKLDEAQRASRNGELGEAATAFQTVMATMLVKELRSSLESLGGEGPGADVYSGWFDDHIGRVLAEDDALGLAGMLKAGMTRTADAAVEGDKEMDQ